MGHISSPEDLKEKLNHLAGVKKVTKTDMEVVALKDYIDLKEKKIKPYDLGADLFDAAGTGEVESSSNYKEEVVNEISKNIFKERKE
mgnify:FL=1